MADKKKKLKLYRAEKDWTQQDLADASGVSRVEISYIENKKVSPTQTTKNKIAKALEVYVTDIREFEDE